MVDDNLMSQMRSKHTLTLARVVNYISAETEYSKHKKELTTLFFTVQYLVQVCVCPSMHDCVSCAIVFIQKFRLSVGRYDDHTRVFVAVLFYDCLFALLLAKIRNNKP